MKLTITLEENQIKEAITKWLQSQGFEALQGSVSIRHYEHDRGMGYYYTASANVTKPEPKP